MTKEELNKMTGANDYNKPRLMTLKSMRLNGDTGKFEITHLDEPKGENDRYRVEEIESPVKVVFLKVRRKLVERGKDGVVMQTNEHNNTNEVVQLWRKDGEAVRGIASDLRQQFENLRTEQIVYVRYKGDIMRLSIKGASLSGTDETTNFYQYLTSFQNSETEWYETQTRLVATLGGDGRRSYYFIDFQVGAALDEMQKEQVYENIKRVHDNCEQVDSAYRENVQVSEKIKQTIPNTDKDYPEEELNPEDIPFNSEQSNS